MKRFLLTIILCLVFLASLGIAKVTVIAPGTVQPSMIPANNACTDLQTTKLPLHQLQSTKKTDHNIPIILDTEDIDSLYYDLAANHYYNTAQPSTFATQFVPLQPCSLFAMTIGYYDKGRTGNTGFIIIHVYADAGDTPGGDLVTPFMIPITGARLARVYVPLPETLDMGSDKFWIGTEEVDTTLSPTDTLRTFPTWDSKTVAVTRNFILDYPGYPGWNDWGSDAGDLNFRAYISYYGGDGIPPIVNHTPISAGFSYDGNYVVKALITDNIAVATASCLYSINGGAYTELVMADSAGYRWASIPAQIPGTLISYYLTAEDAIPNVTRLPQDTTETFSFYVYVGHELKNEFGQFSGAYYIGIDTLSVPDRRFAVKFTPTHYPAVLTMLRFNVVDTAAFDFAVTADTGAPGNLIYGTEEMASPYKTGNHWLSWIIPGAQCPVINSGSFFLEFRYKEGSLDPALGSDSSAPSLNSYFIANVDSGWHNVLSRDWMMRAVVVDTFFNHDVGVTNIDSLPEIGGRTNCDQDMWVNVFNFGNNTETFPVRLKVMDYTDTTIIAYDNSVTVTGLAAKSGRLVHFPTWLQMVPGEYIVSATAQLVGDQYSYNDNDAWYFPVGDVITHLWDDGIAENRYVVQDTASNNDMFAVKFKSIEPDFKVDAALIFAGMQDSTMSSNFAWVRVCPSLTDSTPDIANPFAESLNVQVTGDADPVLIDFPQDSAITGYTDWIWVVAKWVPGQIGDAKPGIFADMSDPDNKSYWTSDDYYPDWNNYTSYDWIMRLYLAYQPCSVSTVPCEYLIGDISGDHQRLGGDVTYGVRYFKGVGSAPKDSCYMDSTHTYLYVAGDCNGNCEFRGSDITRLVAYFKGTAPLSCCHFFPTTLPREYRPNDESLEVNRAVKLDAKRDHKLSKIMIPQTHTR
jgi:hypothetical protein